MPRVFVRGPGFYAGGLYLLCAVLSLAAVSDASSSAKRFSALKSKFRLSCPCISA